MAKLHVTPLISALVNKLPHSDPDKGLNVEHGFGPLTAAAQGRAAFEVLKGLSTVGWKVS